VGTTIPIEAGRTSHDRNPREFATGSPDLTCEERAASALAARGYGCIPPERSALQARADEFAARENLAFDTLHAETYVGLHDLFWSRYAAAYGVDYPRTIHWDWVALRDLVRDYGFNAAALTIMRAFDEDLMRRSGISDLSMVWAWAPRLQGQKRDGSRLSAVRRKLLRDCIAEGGEFKGVAKPAGA